MPNGAHVSKHTSSESTSLKHKVRYLLFRI